MLSSLIGESVITRLSLYIDVEEDHVIFECRSGFGTFALHCMRPRCLGAGLAVLLNDACATAVQVCRFISMQHAIVDKDDVGPFVIMDFSIAEEPGAEPVAEGRGADERVAVEAAVKEESASNSSRRASRRARVAERVADQKQSE